jgi:NADH-quinone oxidoreductase subunit J
MVFNILLTLIFYFATLVIFCNSLVYNILSLVFLIVGSCLILLVLRVEFLAFIFLLVYIGAITVLFVFIVLMLQLNSSELGQIQKFYFYIYSLLYAMFAVKLNIYLHFFIKKLCILIDFFSYEFTMFNEIAGLVISGDSIIFLNIFTQNYFIFLIVGIILLFSMVGSISLCFK